jgi:1,4-alpha-glucan branching enzyme
MDRKPADENDGKVPALQAFDGHAPVDRPSAETARALAAEKAGITDPRFLPLIGIPFLSDYYNETYLYLVPSAPRQLYVLWEVGQGMREEKERRFGPGFLATNHLILRVYDVTGIEFDGFNANSWFEVDDFLNDKVAYWVAVEPGRDWLAELGYRAAGTTFFEKVARSNTVFSPRERPETDERYTAWASVSVPSGDVELPVAAHDWRYNQYLYWKRRSHVAPEEKGCWALVLHQHLPFVRHPEYEVSLEEQWFFEAVTSVYTQLLHMLWRLARDRVDFRLTVSLTPPLLSMMQDPLLKMRAARHIDQCLALARREADSSFGKPWHDTVWQTVRRFQAAKEVFEAYSGDLTRGYRDFQDAGKLEVITCPATHMILPLFRQFPETVRAQIQAACRQYERVFGRWPRGIWLPENGYTPGLDEALAAEGIRWFLLNDKAVLEGDTRPFFGASEPVITPAGLAAFPIDPSTRDRIWSRETGYPGHPNYKEWYRDLGYEADWDYLPAYFRTANVRRNTGIKYYRITGKKVSEKAYYVPAWAEEAVHEQAGQFVFERGAQANYDLSESGGRKGCRVSAYDAELYGHWWEEGPAFLESVFRKMLYDQAEVRPVTPGEYLAEKPAHQRLVPNAGSWGKGDYFQTWVEERAYQPNVWVFRHLYRLCGKMADLATHHREASDPPVRRALNQAGRELFLAGASDWGFLISTGQAVRYSELRIIRHIDRAKELMRQIEAGEVDEGYLSLLEDADTILPLADMDYRIFCR